MRADLWNPQGFAGRDSLPTPGDLLQAAKADFDKDSYDRDWPERAAGSLW